MFESQTVLNRTLSEISPFIKKLSRAGPPNCGIRNWGRFLRNKNILISLYGLKLKNWGRQWSRLRARFEVQDLDSKLLWETLVSIGRWC